ncbi:hypothetical protein [Rubritalea tangerina]|uniref:hypothetical protein n=1 Tax=Rubritalea tangerina TaxID=430798 RepID=UPI00361A8496
MIVGCCVELQCLWPLSIGIEMVLLKMDWSAYLVRGAMIEAKIWRIYSEQEKVDF